METCRFFAQGRCSFGTACRLSHDLPAGATQRRLPPQRQEPPPQAPPWQMQQNSYFEDPCSGFSEQAAASSTWTREEEVPVATSDADLKEARKVQKAIREIEALEERIAAGEKLQGNQLRKIEKKGEHAQRLAELEESLRVQQGPSEPEFAVPEPYSAASRPEPLHQPPFAAQGATIGPPRSSMQPQLAPGSGRGAASEPSAPVCRHFLSGRCSFGDSCRNSHIVPESQGAQQRRPEPSFDVEDPECGICFESIRKKGERFGMLESCDHAFCLTCIRSWRKQREQQDRQNLRLCPVCRNESFFIVPSDEVILDPEEKSRAIETYQIEMARIPCKLFDYGKGKCPFGNSCFYAHLNPDGTRFVPAALRWRNGADGSEVIGEVKLSDFLVRELAI